jgi:hypothetical protein
MIEKNCEVCGTPFQDNSKNHIRKYCSNACNMTAYRTRHIKQLIERRKEAYQRKNGKEYAKQWRHENRDKVLEINRRANLKRADKIKIEKQERRLEALNYISNNNSVCKKCGYSDPRALQIDHINGGGRNESKIYGFQEKFWDYILSQPIEEVYKKYQVLCSNCNLVKADENNERKREYVKKIKRDPILP